MEKNTILYNSKFDKLNPIDKINYLVNNDKVDIQYLNLIIIVLHILNKTFSKEFNINLIYFLDDKSIFYVTKHFFDSTFNDLLKYLKILENCNLIYRFTCAKKFKVDDESLKQLRINSWGEEYYKQIEKNNIVEITDIIEREIKTHYESYKQLTKFVSVINTVDLSLQIKNINKKLNIKIVS